MERPGSNGSCPGCPAEGGPSARAAAALAAVLIFTIVVDVLGNALVILSVLRNKKLRNAGERGAGAGRAGGGAAALPTCGRSSAERSCTAPGSAAPGPARQRPRWWRGRSPRAGRHPPPSPGVAVAVSAPGKGRPAAEHPLPPGHPPPAALRLAGTLVARRQLPSRSPKSRRAAGNIFVVSLSVADLVVAVYPYPLILSAIFHNGWTMGNVHCQISGFLMGLSVIGSIFNITAIAINRYCYICHSLQYDKLFNLKNTCCYLCLTWILTVVAIVPNFFVGSLQYDPRIYSCTFSQTVSTSYTITVVVVHFVVPLSIVTFCYLRIWVLVIQVKHRVRQDCKQKLRAADIRNFLTMFVVFVLFAVCWGPLNFIGLAVSINPSKVQPHIPEWLFVLSYFMAYFNSCLNAVIYGLLNQNFRKEYKRILLTLRTPRLLFIDVSKGGTEGMKSKPSPAVTNNNQAEIHL